MMIVRKAYLFMAALFVFLLAPVTAEAQGGGLTCGWCLEIPVELGGQQIGALHGFPYEGGERGWEGSGMGDKCARCGGENSSCHFPPEWGACHKACGPAGDAEAALTEIQEALEGDNITSR